MMRYSVVILAIIGTVLGHGVMSKPLTRNDYLKMAAYNEQDPNDPINYNEGNPVPFTTDALVCRDHKDSKKQYWLNVTAGQQLETYWENSHPGDAFLYMTLDGDLPHTSMKWFKIWQLAGETKPAAPLSFTIPSYLPSASHAILRWEMYALHLKGAGTVEPYAACVDMILTGATNGQIPTPTVTIPGHLPTAASSYRDVGTTGTANAFFTGPPMATQGGAAWTPGVSSWTYKGDNTPTPTPSSPTPAPTTPTPAPTTPTPTPAPTTPTPTPTSPTTPTTPTPTPTSPTTPTTPSSSNTTSMTPTSNCVIGAKGCSCTPGGACDAGLTCLDKYCLAASDPSNLVNSGAIYGASMALLVAMIALF